MMLFVLTRAAILAVWYPRIARAASGCSRVRNGSPFVAEEAISKGLIASKLAPTILRQPSVARLYKCLAKL